MIRRFFAVVTAFLMLALNGIPLVQADSHLHSFAFMITEQEILQTAENGMKVDKEVLQIRVSQGKRVQLEWRSWQPVALHLHGYDIALQLDASQPATMEFNASAPGRYPITAHARRNGNVSSEHHVTLLYIEVYP